ncbi:hypothetical protein TNIN_306421 [Trichonephila inaurata madagascariensis]|uniref:Uncharacterized protein n=1 Tax=Trichonephila inaurata madagascariensis TaxID=2747483 RepID=A0A8X6MF89_9ARAC|nr:hypothetical protein TNIN_306421 [Trichonephila inaurata madagascariensis]
MLIKKKYLSGEEKRKNQKGKSNKLAEQMNKAYNLLQLNSTDRTSTENLLDTSPSTSTGKITAEDLTPQKIVEKEDKVQMQDDIQTDSNVQ